MSQEMNFDIWKNLRRIPSSSYQILNLLFAVFFDVLELKEMWNLTLLILHWSYTLHWKAQLIMFSPCLIKHAFTVLQGNHHGWWSWNRCFIFFLGKNLNCHHKDKIPTDASSFDLIMSKKDQSIYVKMWKMFCTILSNVVLLNLE